jgi:hypothetical protein
VTDGPGAPIFFCRRWDLLGGRLMALTNTIAVARSFGHEFRFIWPEGRDPYIADPTPLFARAFLERFLFTEEEVASRPVLPEGEILFRDRAGVRELMASLDDQALVEVQHPFDIVRPRDDDPAEAASRFADAFRSIAWSDEAQRLVDFASAWNADDVASALHVRGGDIVSGDWRHSMYYGKYMPLPYVTYAAEELTRGARPLLVLSDNAMLLAWLRRRFDSIVTAADIVPGYDELPVMLRAFADIHVMSRCGSIYGPSDSAFSTLASRVARHPITPADRLVPTGRERTVLSSGIQQDERDLTEFAFLGPFVARDIAWYLDVFGDAVPLGEQLDLARRAAALDTDSVGIATRLAQLAALHGNWQEAAAAASAAVHLGRTVEANPDVLVESLATQVAVECFELAVGLQRPPRPQRGLRHALRPPATPAKQRASITSGLRGLRSSIQSVRETQAYEFDSHAVAENLRDLVDVAEWLSEADDAVLRTLGRRSVSWDGGALEMASFREPVRGAHDDDTTFPAVVRNLDRAVIHLSQVIGSLLTPVREDRTEIRGYEDEITVSPTGVGWLEGWVAANVERDRWLVGGLAVVTSDTFTGAAATRFRFLPVDDEVDLDGLPRGAIGFRVPVPLAVASATDGPDAFRVFVLARDGSASELRRG